MKLLRYGAIGAEKPGLLDATGAIRDLSGHIDDVGGDALSQASLQRLADLDHDALPAVDATTRIGACVASVGKYICIGLNYTDHAAESGMDLPEEPVIFFKATSAIVGPNDDLVKPLNSTRMDWEVELGVVIGTGIVNADEAQATAAIAGYCLCHDVSERAFQFERSGQWVKGKSCDTFGPIGPWLVTPDEIADIDKLSIWCEVNGYRYQDGNTGTMVFKPGFIVSYLSQFMSLQPGDVIATGTPSGVGLGQKPEKYLNVGDTVRLGITGLGEQQQTVVAFG